jgi:hypothetical protein
MIFSPQHVALDATGEHFYVGDGRWRAARAMRDGAMLTDPPLLESDMIVAGRGMTLSRVARPHPAPVLL